MAYMPESPYLMQKNKYSLCAPIAQLVEHLIRNERVAGSNPVGSSNKN